MSRPHGRVGRPALAGLMTAALTAAALTGTASGAPGDVTVSQVADIRPGLMPSQPQSLIDAGGILLFSANDGTDGTELWRSNGGALGPGGTEMIANLEPGAGGSTPLELTNIGGTVLFRASTSVDGSELWKIDPPYTTPVQVENINPTAGSSPNDLTDVNGTLFFQANDGATGDELWKSAPPYDAASTDLVENIVSGSGSSSPNGLFNANGTLFFDANDGTDDELWQSVSPYNSGSTAKLDVNPSGDSFPGPFAEADGTLLFAADGGTDGFELWKCAVPCSTPVQVEDINTGVGADSSPSDLTNVNGTVFFHAEDATADFELWKSIAPYDSGSTTKIDVNPTGSSDPDQLAGIGGLLYFSAGDGVHGVEPWKSNGGPVGTGTDLVQDINLSDGSFPFDFTDVNDTAFFPAFDSAGPELYRSTGVGATKLTSIFSNGSAPQQLTNVAGTLFFVATDSSLTTGQELWKATIEPTPAPVVTPPTPVPAPVAKKKKCKKKKHGKKSADAAKKKKCKKKKK
jgi:ELWxxDGT repeat protein